MTRRSNRVSRPRLAVAVAAAVMLTLTSTVTHAAWTASTSASGNASTGTIALTSSGISGLAFTYPSVDSTTIVPISLSNSGSVALPLTSASISTTGTLSASNVTLTLWQRTGTTCPASIPGATTSKATTGLGAGSLALPTGFASVPAGGSVNFCAATTLTGPLADTAGRQITATLTFSGQVGAAWTAIDTSAGRTFTQSVAGLAAPRIVDCIAGKRSTWIYDYDTARIIWTSVPGATSYRLYRNGVAIGSPITGTELIANGSTPVITQGGTITVRAFAGSVQSEPSNPLTVTTYDPVGFITGNDVRCGAIG